MITCIMNRSTLSRFKIHAQCKHCDASKAFCSPTRRRRLRARLRRSRSLRLSLCRTYYWLPSWHDISTLTPQDTRCYVWPNVLKKLFRLFAGQDPTLAVIKVQASSVTAADVQVSSVAQAQNQDQVIVLQHEASSVQELRTATAAVHTYNHHALVDVRVHGLPVSPFAWACPFDQQVRMSCRPVADPLLWRS